ncbi:hypothetical protein, variant [Aphanomyces astaci]|uniref:Uncharacterized protein n=1 Tax=Aphanomyces astaci TaxID=112090 RepID=W4FNY9_APHAT|nr:hypothetical protein, variant [Aphanomyces astaci]ETV68398.1 hypothetical protein, variant [Aphanomyces astaci]|eukprot:XP_009842192.1 hypothetical protein, variant [Aphanomyces astaci]
MTPSTRGSDSVSTSTAATDAVRRVYFREKQREHRMKNRSKHSRLMQRVHDLEKLLRLATMSTTKLPPRKRPLSNQSDLLLPWKVVADVMKQELEASEACQAILRDRIDMSVAVIRDMQRFASLHDSLLQPSWRHMTLFANPESRHLGKLWITQHMYLNKDAVFQHFAFPPLSSPERVQEYDLVFTESDCYYLLQRSHLTFDVPMEALRRMNHEHLCSLLLLADSTSNDEKIDEPDMRYQVTPLGECVNVVLGEFADGHHQCTHVVQQIQDDERRPHSHRQRNRSTWSEISIYTGNDIVLQD